jgi:hypothetical protein
MIAISAKPESDSETTFDLPKGVDFTDVKEGDEKEVTAVLRKEADGKVCIVKVNGVPLNKDDEEEESSDEQEAEGPADSEAMAPPSPTMGSAAQSVGLM